MDLNYFHMKEEKIIYQLSQEDAQTVAIETLGRNLTKQELNLLPDIIAEKIPWFDIIAEAIKDLPE